MEQEDCQPPNGAGWAQREPVTLDQVIDVLTLKTRCDPNGKEITHWANQLQEADLFADLDSQMLAAMLYAVMNSNCAYLSGVQEYVRFKVKCELEG